MAAPMRVPSEHPPMTRDEFRRWAVLQPRGRYERVDGYVISMSPERLGHARIKGLVWKALDTALTQAGAPCIAFPDGATVEIDGTTDYEPDVTVNCGDNLDYNATAAPTPLIVVEVTSPSTQAVDVGEKLADYFRVASIQHYLIVIAHRRQVIHHRRSGSGIETRIVTQGPLHLDPPGITVTVEDFYAGMPQ